VVNTKNFIEENNHYDVFGESPKFEGFNLEVEEIGLVDFLGVDNMLSNFLDDGGFDKFYVVDDNIMIKTKEILDPFWEIFMAHEMEKISGVRVKIALSQLVVKNFQDDTHILVVIKEVLFILGWYIILLLNRKGWKGLISHPKDRGKNHHNARTDYLQPGKDDLNSMTNSFPTQ
jgi:hypothetical protein